VKKAFNHIWKACSDGDLDMVRIMVREGQNPSEKTQNMGNSPLHVAARGGHYLIVKYLLEINANATQQNNNGLTPKQFLQEALISDPSKLEAQCKKQKTAAAADKLRADQKKLSDTLKLLLGAEAAGGKRRV